MTGDSRSSPQRASVISRLRHRVGEAERLPWFLRPHAGDGAFRAISREFVAFGWKQALSCVFPATIFAMLAALRAWPIPGVPRYDAALAGCLLSQWAMWLVGMETLDEVRVIGVFHLLGLAMELHKVQHGSWAYPEPAWTKLGGVPLYSGFMYASVASYMCQAWRRFDLAIGRWPPVWAAGTLAIAIYLNFFTNHWLPDARIVLFAGVAVVFARGAIDFTPNGARRRMPAIIAFVLIAFFIWLAENLGTYLDAWRYPHQRSGWRAVTWQKLSSWTLLVIVSLILVAELKRLKARLAGKTAADAIFAP